jgi:chaperone BCS1
MLITLEIPSKDRSYPWFLEWMAAQAEQARAVPLADRGLRGAFSGKINQLPSHELAVETTYKQHDNGASEALFNLVPGPGTHYFRYGGHWFQVCGGQWWRALF